MKRKEKNEYEDDEWLEEEEDTKKEFSDDASIIRHLTKIHTPKSDLSEDNVLYQPNEKQKEFAIKQLNIAMRVYDFIAEKKIAKQASRALIREPNSIAILERNKPENWLVKKILKRSTTNQEEEEEEKKGWLDTLLGKKNKKKDQEE